MLASPARSVIVFHSTVRAAALTAGMLSKLGVACLPLHSGMPQSLRTASLTSFKSSSVRVLVATDVAARGLDIPLVDAVVNADVPGSPEDYVHRVGRAARAGAPGAAITLVTQTEVGLLQAIEAGALGGVKLTALSGLNEDTVLASLSRVAAATHAASLELESSGFNARMEEREARRRREREG